MARIIRRINLIETIETIEVNERLSIPWKDASANSIRAAVWRAKDKSFRVKNDKKHDATVITRIA